MQRSEKTMNRKIVKLGEQTLVVSLPSIWLREQGLGKGDELCVDVQDTKLILTPPLKAAGATSMHIDIAGVDERSLRWQVSSLHKQGFDEIVVTNYTPEQYRIIEDLITHLFLGFIIKEKTHLRIVIGQVAVVDAAEFDATLRRAFRLLDAALEDLQTAMLNQDGEMLLRQMDHEHDNNKLTNFCERLLNKTLTRKEKGHFWYVIVWNLEKIVDNGKYIAKAYEDVPLPDLSKETRLLLADVREYATGYYECFYDFSFKRLVKLSKQKRTIERACLDGLLHAPVQERVLVHYLHMLVLQLADFSASMIALRYKGDA